MESGWFPECTFPEYISVLNHPAGTHPVQTYAQREHTRYLLMNGILTAQL